MSTSSDNLGAARGELVPSPKPFCMGGPPTTLLEAVRRVMQPKGGAQRPLPFSPVEVHQRIRREWPDSWPLASTLDVANEMRGFYG